MDGFVIELERFYRERKKALLAYALALTGAPDSAEDAVHDAFASILRGAFRPKELSPYVFKCVRNAAADRWRRERKEDEFICDYSIFADVEDAAALDIDELTRCLARLSRERREVIVLKIYEELTFKQIASVMNASQNTVASWYRRGMDALRRMMEKTDNE